MKSDTIKLFSSVKPSLLRSSLMRGTLLATAGVLLLIFSTTWLPESIMVPWSFLLLLVGGGLMIFGLLPYRKLTRLEKIPNELLIVDDQYVQYIEKGKEQYTIPASKIEKIVYIEKGQAYGIGICLKEFSEERVMVHNRKLDMDGEQVKNKKKYSCDLFIPYFSKRAYARWSMLNVN